MEQTTKFMEPNSNRNNRKTNKTEGKIIKKREKKI